MSTHRITELIQKFCPHSFNIPIDRGELERVAEKLYQLMFPTSSKLHTHLIHAELVLLAEVLQDNISKLTSPKFAEDVMEKFSSNCT